MAAEPRHDLPIPLRVELVRPEGAATAEYAVNLSAGGLCLQLRDPLRVGDEVGVAFTLPPSGPRVEARAEVVWIHPLEDGGAGPRLCETGIRFQAMAPELRSQLSRYAEESRERRR